MGTTSQKALKIQTQFLRVLGKLWCWEESYQRKEQVCPVSFQESWCAPHTGQVQGDFWFAVQRGQESYRPDTRVVKICTILTPFCTFPLFLLPSVSQLRLGLNTWSYTKGLGLCIRLGRHYHRVKKTSEAENPEQERKRTDRWKVVWVMGTVGGREESTKAMQKQNH